MRKIIPLLFFCQLIAFPMTLFAETPQQQPENTAKPTIQQPGNCVALVETKTDNGVMSVRIRNLPEGVTIVNKKTVRFDPELWSLDSADDGLVYITEMVNDESTDAKKKKKKKKKGGDGGGTTTYLTCLCGGSDSRGGCLAFTNTRTGEVHCENTGCTEGCGIAIFGDIGEIEDVTGGL